MRNFFDRLCSSMTFCSNYVVPYCPLEKSSHTKSGDKFTLCSEVFIFLLSSTITEQCPGFTHYLAALYGLVLCLQRLMSTTHTLASLDTLEQDIAYFVTLLQLRDTYKTFSFINFHLSRYIFA